MNSEREGRRAAASHRKDMLGPSSNELCVRCLEACHAVALAKEGRNETDPDPFMRGINSIQLFNDGKRW